MLNNQPSDAVAVIPAVWRSNNGKPNFYWNPERGTFRCTLTFIPTGNQIRTRLAKAVAKNVVIERNDFGTGVIGYLVHTLTAKRLLREAQERQQHADRVRERKQARLERLERERCEAEQRAALAEVGILRALFSINRAAKRRRDEAVKAWNRGCKAEAGSAAEQKRIMYFLKGQALEWLVRDGTLSVVGYHVFPGANYAEVLAGQGYRFHRPAEPPIGVQPELIDEIESKPVCEGEVEASVAIRAVEGYLDGKPELDVYKWPVRERPESADYLREDEGW